MGGAYSLFAGLFFCLDYLPRFQEDIGEKSIAGEPHFEDIDFEDESNEVYHHLKLVSERVHEYFTDKEITLGKILYTFADLSFKIENLHELIYQLPLDRIAR